MTELFLQYLWNYKIFNRLDFKDTEGNTVEILDFGTWNTNAGADFLYAKIKTKNIVFVGHIELHLRSSDWELHQHSKDKAYQNVILHAVYEHDKDIAFLKNKNIPTIVLKNYINTQIIEHYLQLSIKKHFIPCEDLFFIEALPIQFHQENVLKKLDEKSLLIEQQLLKTKNDYESVLFRNMAYGFGLKINADTFLSIAESIDFSIIRKLSQNITQLESFFIGKAGWLEETLDEQSQIWKREYQFITQKFRLNDGTFPPKFLRLRPPNFPTIRLSQLAHLYNRNPHLFSQIMESHTYQELKMIFKNIQATKYWDNHYQIGKKTKQSSPKTLSSSFIDLLILNVVLPLKYTYHKHSEGDTLDNILNIYADIPPEKNTIIEKWKKLGCKINNALESQSYLYQYKNFCLQKKCLNCSVGLKILRN